MLVRLAPGMVMAAVLSLVVGFGEGTAAAVDMDDIPSGDLPPLMVEDGLLAVGAALPPEARSRGVHTWVSAEIIKALREESFTDTTAYSMSGKKYSVGLRYDWSVDTVLGAGIDLLDATVEAGRPYDARTTELRGVFANASLDTVLFDSFLIGLKGFYGKIGSEGGGSIGAWNNAGATVVPWRESDNTSNMYGLSGKLSVPMMLWDYRAVLDAGFDYKRIKTGKYTYQVGNDPAQPMDRELSSDSLAFPLGFSMEKDFAAPWALVTARAGAGYTYETSDTASGVRSLHAVSAAPFAYHSAGFYDDPAGFATLDKGMYNVSLGLDVTTAGGWNFAAEYRRDFASAYHRDSFSFELGRSF